MIQRRFTIRTLILIAGLAFSSPGVAADPFFTTHGTCPGAATINVYATTPNGTLALLSGNAVGNSIIPAGPCAGTQTTMAGLTLRQVVTADFEGFYSFQFNLPAAACDAVVQILDVATCTLSPVREIWNTTCNGFEDPLTGACWYSTDVGQSCNNYCDAGHGGFNVVKSTHIGDVMGFTFWPTKAVGGWVWETVECSSVDNYTNWGANGLVPDGNFTHPACHLECACFN